MLLGDREDLIQKTSGWVHREAANRHLVGLKEFIAKHQKAIPRTALC